MQPVTYILVYILPYLQRVQSSVCLRLNLICLYVFLVMLRVEGLGLMSTLDSCHWSSGRLVSLFSNNFSNNDISNLFKNATYGSQSCRSQLFDTIRRIDLWVRDNDSSDYKCIIYPSQYHWCSSNLHPLIGSCCLIHTALLSTDPSLDCRWESPHWSSNGCVHVERHGM